MLEMLTPLIPEVYLFTIILVSFCFGIFSSQKNKFKNSYIIAVTGLISLTGLYFLKLQGSTEIQTALSDLFVSYPAVNTAKFIASFISVIFLISAKEFLATKQAQKFEFNVLYLLALLGGFIALSTFNLMVLFIGLELFSFSLYILVGFLRNEVAAIRSATKYFIVGGVASSLMLYGISLLYLQTGDLSYKAFALSYLEHGFTAESSMHILSFSLVAIGLFFKLTIVPMQLYIADVYYGANRPILGVISTVSKIVGFVILLQLLAVAIPFSKLTTDLYYYIFLGFSVATIIVGSAFAIKEDNINKFLAYSSVNNAGFMLVLASLVDTRSLMYYLIAYCLISAAFVCAVLSYKVKGEYTENLKDLFAVAKQKPMFGFVFVMILFALAGIPPFMMFYAKMLVFKALVAKGFIAMAVLAVFASVLAVSYCLRAVKLVYFEKTEDNLLLQQNTTNLVLTYIIFALVVVLSLMPSMLL